MRLNILKGDCMNHMDEKREQSINKVANGVKILMLLFSIIGFLRYGVIDCINGYKAGYVILALVCVMLLGVYILSFFRNKNRILKSKGILFQYSESFVFIFIFSKLIIISGGIYSNYVVILIIFIIGLTIQRGLILSIIVSVYSSLFILILSYINSRSVLEVVFNDLMLSMSFILICLVLNTLLNEEKSARERIIETSNIDYLTKIYNRRYFNSVLRKKYEVCKTSERSMAIILLDIDFFKKINDSYGHLFGDMVLRKVANIIKTSSGDKNTVARYGGEEFGIILCKHDTREAKIVAEHIRKEIEESSFFYEDTGENVKITASLGICTYPELSNNVYELIKKADEALYKAKNIGRNRVELYEKHININWVNK